MFIPGQRWVSNTESEAGLGIVVEQSNRRVTISYPAIAEERTYAAGNAPLSRVRYNPGDKIRSADGLVLTVEEVREEGGYITYLGSDAEGSQQLLEELELDSFVQFSKPQNRLFAGQIDKLSRFELRQQTLQYNHRHQQSDVLGLQGARVQLLPHQLYIANEVTSRHAPRVLLADEVGLGKTIEAGLIIHQQLVSGRAGRVLIVVPDSLVHQWLVEMLRRFNLMFTIFDEERCQALTENDEQGQPGNPFESAQLVLCNLSFLTRHANRLQQACDAGWDLMAVDEAHHLQWSEQQTSPEYQCIESLAQRVSGLLLLTATPEQLGVESHFARLRLLDPDRYYDLQKFCDEEHDYQRVSSLVEQLTAQDALQQLRHSEHLKTELQHYMGDAAAELGNKLQGELDDDNCQQAVEDVVRALLDRHGTGRVLFRNTRDAVAGFPERCLNPHKLATPAAYNSQTDGATLEQLLKPELLPGSGWLATDPRVKWLSQWLAENRDQKVLVICANADTAEQLEDHLNLRCGIHSAVFHEGMNLVQRDRAAAYFADEDENAQVLVCSEIGSEGRNFQFARHMVLFDLPLNPDLLEQRIGRLDRIGQRHTVQIHVPFYDSGAQFALLRWYHDGLNAFERVCPVGAAIYTQVADQLEHCLRNSEDSAALEALVKQTYTATEAALYEFQQGRDRLLEMSSCHPTRAQQVVEQVAEAESPQQLSAYMEKVFDQYGVDHHHHSVDAVILEPSDHLQCDSFPGLLEDGMTATFSRVKALSREDMHFLSWEHPMVSGAMEMILGSDFGNTALCTIKLPPLKPGNLLLETVFTLHCAAPKSLQLQRFMPASRLRVVVEANGRDLSSALTAQHFSKLGKKVAIGTAQELVRHARPQITQLISRAESLAQAQQDDLVAKAIDKMQRQQTQELQRLQSLAQVNPNIRQQEIDYIADTSEQLELYLAAAELRLDSLRVAVTV